MMSESTTELMVSELVVDVPRSTLPLTVKDPLLAMLPVEDATEKLTVVPDLTEKLLSIFVIPFISVSPATVRPPPSVVLPLFTFKYQ